MANNLRKILEKIETNFPCKKCNKVLKTYKSLQNHESEIHGESPEPNTNKSIKYFCKAKKCGKSFTRPYTLVDHMWTIHNEVLDVDAAKQQGKKTKGN